MDEFYFYTDNLSVGYGDTPLIKDICLQLKKGEILTLIGPNGAGKSTILKSLTRQLAWMGGTVYLDKQALDRMSNPEIAQKMSVMMPERLQPEMMTCEDMVSMGRYPYTGKLGILSEDDWRIVSESLALVHASDLAKQDFNCISDGQRQRVLLARALCQEPEVLVLDEPTSFLDIRHKLELLHILKDMVRKRQLTVVMSLHELDLAQKISDRVVCVHNNQIEKYGTPEEIFTDGYVQSLYDITKGSYNALFGCVEMEPVRGEPEVFVIAGNGSGIPYFRMLQRQGIPFAAGVLAENDVDYVVARELAAEVIAQQAFLPISEETVTKAKACMKKCRKVLVTVPEFLEGNRANEELVRYAREDLQIEVDRAGMSINSKSSLQEEYHR
ncbi:MAG: ABC transporter ATP-binding protein [Clostridiales bacterium]|nr:ABC transporter ATP-binding protein [Clostridiales bacterium]